MPHEDDWIYKKPTSYGSQRSNTSEKGGGSLQRHPAGEPANIKPLCIDNNLDRNTLKRTRRWLLFGSFWALVGSIATLVGGIMAYSLCLIANSAAFLFIFARLLFLAFLLHNAGRPTSRLQLYRRHKPEIYVALLALLFGWLIMGGSLYQSIIIAHLHNQPIISKYWFMGTSAFGILFAIIFLIAQVCGIARKQKIHIDSRVRQTVGELIPSYSRERGLMLRKTLKNVPMKPYFLFTVWFFFQCLLAFIGSGIFGFYNIQVQDYYLSLAFVPLTVIGSLVLIRDIVNLLTEGILQGLDFSEVTESLLAIDGVTGVRRLRIWALTMDRISLSVTLAIDSNTDIENVLNRASALLKAKYDIFEYSLDSAPESRATAPRRLF